MILGRGLPVKAGGVMKWIIAGWLLFIVSAAFFILSAWRSGDMLALGGGFFFLVACFSFLVPITRGDRH